MKGVFCSHCNSFRSLHHEDRRPVWCECGNVAGWWTDGSHGLAAFHAKNCGEGFSVNLSNVYLYGIVTAGYGVNDESFRHLHDAAADGQDESEPFHKSRRNCWGFIVRPGIDPDSVWATAEECERVGIVSVIESELDSRRLAGPQTGKERNWNRLTHKGKRS